MKRSLPAARRPKSKAALELLERVELGAFTASSPPRQREEILRQLVKFVQSKATSDADIVYLLMEEGRTSLPLLLSGDLKLERPHRALLLQAVFSLKLAVLDKFDMDQLIPFLISFCRPTAEVPQPDLDEVGMALTQVQSVVVEPLIPVLVKHNCVSTLKLYAMGTTLGGALVQMRALQILQHLTAFEDADLCQRTFNEFYRVELFSGLENVVADGVVGIFCILKYAPAGGQAREDCAKSVLALLANYPLKLDIVKLSSSHGLEMMPLVLNYVCGWGGDYCRQVYLACVRDGWFPCFANQIKRGDDTLELLHAFAKLGPGVLLHNKAGASAMQVVVEGLKTAITRTRTGSPFWKEFCLLTLGNVGGVPNAELPGGKSSSRYVDHLHMAVSSLCGWVHPKSGEDEPGSALHESLASILFVLRRLGSRRTQRVVAEEEDDEEEEEGEEEEGGEDDKEEEEEEESAVHGLGGLWKVLVRAEELAHKRDDAASLKLSRQCLAYFDAEGVPSDPPATDAAASAATIIAAPPSTPAPPLALLTPMRAASAATPTAPSSMATYKKRSLEPPQQQQQQQEKSEEQARQKRMREEEEAQAAAAAEAAWRQQQQEVQEAEAKAAAKRAAAARRQQEEAEMRKLQQEKAEKMVAAAKLQQQEAEMFAAAKKDQEAAAAAATAARKKRQQDEAEKVTAAANAAAAAAKQRQQEEAEKVTAAAARRQREEEEKRAKKAAAKRRQDEEDKAAVATQAATAALSSSSAASTASSVSSPRNLPLTQDDAAASASASQQQQQEEDEEETQLDQDGVLTQDEDEEDDDEDTATSENGSPHHKPQRAGATATAAAAVLENVRQQLVRHTLSFSCVREMSLLAFQEIGLGARDYLVFRERWLVPDAGVVDGVLDSLPASPAELNILRRHKGQRAALLAMTEIEWLAMGLRALTWSRAQALVRQMLEESFEAWIQGDSGGDEQEED